jgi:geranylgeranyl reductase family protein
MLETEILIVGGGPAGSTLARALTQAGMSVVIMDKAEFPRSKVCAGWVTPAVMQELEIDTEDYAREHELQAINGFRTAQMGQQAIRSDFPGSPVSYGIRRIEFDNYLLRRCGARLLLGQAFKSMQRQSDWWIVNDAIKARLVVGAGGHFCPVARAIGAKKSSETTVAAQEIEFKMSPQQKIQCPVLGEVPELYFTPDLKGYGWVFRKGDYLNIGLGREDRHKLSGHVERFCHDLVQSGRIPQDLPAKFKGHAYLLYPHARRTLVQDGVLLIGDAAGLAYAQSGEGIRPAVESGLLAAKVIMGCRSDYSARGLSAYPQQLEKRFGVQQPHSGLGDRIPTRLKQFLAKRLMKNHYLSRNLLIRHWFLRIQDKPLATGQCHVL